MGDVIGLWTRLRVATARQLGIVAGLALGAAVALDRAGHGAGIDVGVGLLFGVAVGLGTFALGAFARSRPRR